MPLGRDTTRTNLPQIFPVLWVLKTSVLMSQKLILGSIQWPWNSPKTNSLHCSLIVVSIYIFLYSSCDFSTLFRSKQQFSNPFTPTFPLTILFCTHTNQISLLNTTSLDSWSHTSHSTSTAFPPMLCQYTAVNFQLQFTAKHVFIS